MKERAIIEQGALTKASRAPYYRCKDIFMAVAEVGTQVATEVAKTAVDTTKPVVDVAAEIGKDVANTAESTAGEVAKAGENIADTTGSMVKDATVTDPSTEAIAAETEIKPPEGSTNQGDNTLSPGDDMQALEKKVEDLQTEETASKDSLSLNSKAEDDTNDEQPTTETSVNIDNQAKNEAKSESSATAHDQPEEGEANDGKEPFENVDQAKEKTQEILKEVGSDPEYHQIFGERYSEAEKDGQEPDVDKVKAEALEIYRQRQEEAANKDAENESSLSPEQKKEIAEVFRKGFRDHPEEMQELSKKTIELAKAKAREEELKNNANATEENKTKAAEDVNTLQKEYKEIFDKFKEKFGERNPELVKYMALCLENDEALVILKRRRKMTLLELLRKAMTYMALSIIKETTKQSSPLNQQQQ